MPLAYSLADDFFIPFDYDSSDDDEGPRQLPDGRLVCRPHGFVYCHTCCTDYSLGDDLGEALNDLGVENDFPGFGNRARALAHAASGATSDAASSAARGATSGPSAHDAFGMVRGTGLVFPSKFVPPSNAQPPLDLFTGRKRYLDSIRFTLPNDRTTLLVLTDGACLNNGQANPRAGWGFVHGVSPEGKPLVASYRLEQKGPWGDDGIQSSNRAELRAVIAALRYRYWPDEGFNTIVIATDSEYVVEGSTLWSKTWVSNNWKTRSKNEGGRASVKNRDMWEALLGECERAHRNGMTIKFWKIPREWNRIADEAAKKAAAAGEAPVLWSTFLGLAF